MSPHHLVVGARYLISWRVPLYGGNEHGRGSYEVLGREGDGKWRLRPVQKKGNVIYLFAHEIKSARALKGPRRRTGRA